jgi:hypothetical protein
MYWSRVCIGGSHGYGGTRDSDHGWSQSVQRRRRTGTGLTGGNLAALSAWGSRLRSSPHRMVETTELGWEAMGAGRAGGAGTYLDEGPGRIWGWDAPVRTSPDGAGWLWGQGVGPYLAGRGWAGRSPGSMFWALTQERLHLAVGTTDLGGYVGRTRRPSGRTSPDGARWLLG